MIALSFEISFTSQLIFVSQKLEQVVKSKKVQPQLINQQCMVSSLSFHLSYVDYVGYTARNLHQCIFTHKNSAIGEELLEAHGSLQMKINFGSFAIDVQSLNALCTTCCLPMNAMHASKQRPRLLV